MLHRSILHDGAAQRQFKECFATRLYISLFQLIVEEEIAQNGQFSVTNGQNGHFLNRQNEAFSVRWQAGAATRDLG